MVIRIVTADNQEMFSNHARYSLDDLISVSCSFAVGDQKIPATGIGTLGVLTMIGNELGAGSFTDAGKPVKMVEPVKGHRSANNGVHFANYEGWLWAASEEKYLEIHGLEHWTHFYTDYGREIQLRFFDQYLKGEGDWRESQAPVQRQRRWPGERFEDLAETDWPHPETEWTKLYLDASEMTLGGEPPSEGASVTYEAAGELNRLKLEHGLLSRREAQRVAGRIRRERKMMSEIDRISALPDEEGQEEGLRERSSLCRPGDCATEAKAVLAK